jgi:hypothetical protein
MEYHECLRNKFGLWDPGIRDVRKKSNTMYTKGQPNDEVICLPWKMGHPGRRVVPQWVTPPCGALNYRCFIIKVL